MRQHQFYKVELVSIVEPNKCLEELERMLGCAESILEKLEIPYQVVLLSTGDMGFSVKKLMILRHGFLQRINIEKYQVVPLVVLFKPEEWALNINLKTGMSL